MSKTKPTKRGDGLAQTTYNLDTLDQVKRDDAERKRDYEEQGPWTIAPEHDRLNGATLCLPPCGCNITGRGTCQYPIRIKFCEKHGSQR